MSLSLPHSMGASEALMVFSHEYCEKATHICMYSLKGAVSPELAWRDNNISANIVQRRPCLQHRWEKLS
jgi:hypothetical protein